MKYKFIAEGENCDTCNKLNGKVFDIKDAKVGVNLQPMHPNCDCMTGILDHAGNIEILLCNRESKDGKDILTELLSTKLYSLSANFKLYSLRVDAINPGLSPMLDLPFLEWINTSKMTTEHLDLIESSWGHFPKQGTVEWGDTQFVEWLIGFVFNGGKEEKIEPFKDQWIAGYKDAIIAAAIKYDIPPVFAYV